MERNILLEQHSMKIKVNSILKNDKKFENGFFSIVKSLRTPISVKVKSAKTVDSSAQEYLVNPNKMNVSCKRYWTKSLSSC